jgi:hypothetical protein
MPDAYQPGKMIPPNGSAAAAQTIARRPQEIAGVQALFMMIGTPANTGTPACVKSSRTRAIS